VPHLKPCIFCHAAETEGFDLVGQVAPYTVAEALALIPKLASQLLARLQHRRSTLPAQAASTVAEKEAALVHLVQTDLPAQLQQYQEEAADAAAAAAAAAQASGRGTAGQYGSSDNAIADLLGLGEDEWAQELLPYGEQQQQQQQEYRDLDSVELQTDADLAAAAAAAARYAPDLHAAVQEQQQAQAQEDGGAASDQMSDWAADDDAYELLFGAASPSGMGGVLQEWEAVPAVAAHPDSTAAAAAATAASDHLATDAGSGSLAGQPEDGGEDDAYALLFGDAADLSEDAMSVGSGSWQSLDTSHPAEGNAIRPEGARETAAELRSGASMAAAASASYAGSNSANAAAASHAHAAAFAAANSEAALPAAAGQPQEFDLDDFVASLSLHSQAHLQRPEAAAAMCRSSALQLPESLKNAIRQTLDILDTIVSAHRSAAECNSGVRTQPDAASMQLLHKLQSLWQHLCMPGLNTADPLFLFRDGPVTTAAKLGQPILLEDFNR
jgi:hypothetical protein